VTRTPWSCTRRHSVGEWGCRRCAGSPGTVRPTQTDPDTSTGGRLLGPDGRYEHLPLRFVRVRTADIDALSAAAAALREPVRTEAVSDALRLHAGHRAQDRQCPDPDAALVALVARVAGVLDLEWTRDAELLRARLGQPVDAGGDVVLTAAEETAYQRVITGFNRMWTLAEPGSTGCGPSPNRVQPDVDPRRTGFNRMWTLAEPGSTGCGPSPTQWTASPTDRGERLAPSTGRDHCCRLPRRRASRSDRGRCASRLTAASPPGPEDSALVEFAAAWWLIVDRPQTGGAVWGSVAVAVRAGVVGSEGS